jgi:hypothetical protein
MIDIAKPIKNGKRTAYCVTVEFIGFIMAYLHNRGLEAMHNQ